MELPCFAISFFVIVLVGIVIAISVSINQGKTINATYARLAQHYQGKVYPSGLMHRPSIRFSYQDASVLVDTFSTGGKHPKYYTQFHISWPDSKLRCEVYPEALLRQLGKIFFNMQDIEIGSPAFDRDYIIRGNSITAIQELLSPEVQVRINSLRQFSYNDDIYFSIKGGTLLVKKLGLIRDYEKLKRFVSLSLALYDDALARGTEGIEFFGEQLKVPDDGTTVCQICGDSLIQDIVFCKSCRTPHHEDCWEYNKVCSTYGCGQSKFVRPVRSAKSADT